MAVRVLLASDIRLYREGLQRMLQAVERIELAGSASSSAETLEHTRSLAPDVVLLDMLMAEAFSIARQVPKVSRHSKVVALCVSEVEAEIFTCAEAGVAGYVTRDGSVNDVLAAIESAARGELHCSPKIAALLSRRIAALSTERRSSGVLAGLTVREEQILRLMQQGLSNKMISRSLGIELPTVKNHVHSILAKLGVHRRTEAISLLQRLR